MGMKSKAVVSRHLSSFFFFFSSSWSSWHFDRGRRHMRDRRRARSPRADCRTMTRSPMTPDGCSDTTTTSLLSRGKEQTPNGTLNRPKSDSGGIFNHDNDDDDDDDDDDDNVEEEEMGEDEVEEGRDDLDIAVAVGGRGEIEGVSTTLPISGHLRP